MSHEEKEFERKIDNCFFDNLLPCERRRCVEDETANFRKKYLDLWYEKEKLVKDNEKLENELFRIKHK